jgi:hypothetical protein
MGLMRHTLLPAAVLAAALAATACGSRAVQIDKVLQATDVTTGWFDAGIVEGAKNKLVPSISLRLKNTDAEPIASVQLFARFAQLNDPQEWGTPPYVKAIGPEGLAPGQSTALMVLHSNLGYTGEQPRLEMLQNSQFVDARVEIFVKYQSNNWVKLVERPIARQLITR